MKKSLLIFALLPLASRPAQTAPKPIPAGAGSYAEFPPAHEDEGRNGTTIAATLAKKLHIDPAKADAPVPTNAWWTDLIVSPYAGRLWAHPLCVTADENGLEIFHPTEWNDEGRDMLLGPPLAIRGEVDASALPKSADLVLADFETETYGPGWTLTGEAFGDGPSAGAVEGQTPVSDYAGKRLANSIHEGDNATGTLTSPEFSIQRGFIHFLIAGGRLPEEAHVDLMVNGEVAHSETGEDSEQLKWRTWDVTALKGRRATLRLVDDATGGWGHILADQFVLTDSPTPPTKPSGNRFAPTEARALDWSDWLVKFRMPQTDTQFMDVTLGHGMPSVWLEFTGVAPVLEVGDAAWSSATGEPAGNSATGDAIRLEQGGRFYAVFAPDGTEFSRQGAEIRVKFTSEKSWLVVSALPEAAAFEQLHATAFAVPRKTRLAWNYDPAKAEVTTRWTIETEPLKGTNQDVIQGWIPHHYRGTRQALTFDGLEYKTARGLMKCATGREFEISYPFTGLLPTLPAPAADAAGFDQARMKSYLSDYSEKTEYGNDTYWGGKDVLCLARNLAMARQMKMDPEAAALHDTLRGALTDWFTYTDGEAEHYFAHYPRWKGIIGFNESYGSGEFNDLHFHYGYFTTAAALLGMDDPEFLEAYGPMVRLVAKQYANWERDDAEFPFLRTFDVWEGHSWAGGYSSGGGNNQESSSEAMQSWGGLFLLGAVSGDDKMRDAGVMGFAMEEAATREYWFDYYGKTKGATEAVFPPQYAHGITGIFFAGGRAFGTYFTGDPGWVYGIQWLPASPFLAYLGQDPAFAQWQLDQMWKERAPWIAAENAKNPDKEPMENTVASMGNLGTVILGFVLQFDPAWVIAQMDDLYAADDPIATRDNMSGILYYLAEANQALGRVRWDWHTSIPTSAVYRNEKTGETRAVIYNPQATPQTATIYAGGHPAGQVTVPARTLVSLPPPG